MSELFLDLLHEPKSSMLPSGLRTLATSRAHEKGLVSKNWAIFQGVEGVGWQPHVIIDKIEIAKKEETPIRTITPLVFSALRVVSQHLKCTKINQPIFSDKMSISEECKLRWLSWLDKNRKYNDGCLHFFLYNHVLHRLLLKYRL